MSDPGWALQVALHATLLADTALTTLLGGNKVYDHVSRSRTYPYITFGQSTQRDWSTGTETGSEHAITLHVWSQDGGRQQAAEILDAVRAALHDQPLTLAGHRLVNLRTEALDIRRDPDGETFHGMLRLRATTEPETP
jgi:Protein of unknown function (DUF3168)